MLLSGGDKGLDKLIGELGNLVALVFKVELYIKCHLVVSASCGVKSLACVTQSFGEHLLNEHMDILSIGVKMERTAVKVGKYALKSLDYLFALVLFNNALLAQHLRMSHRASYIMPVHSCIKGNGGVEVVDLLIDLLGKSSCPHLSHFISFLSNHSAAEVSPDVEASEAFADVSSLMLPSSLSL